MMIKNIIILLVLFIIKLHALGQIDIALKLESVTGRETNCSYFDFELYQEDSLITNISCEPIFTKIYPGIYTLKYLNIYDIKKTLTFNTDTLINNSITVYIDKVDYGNIKINSLIDLIRNNKPLTITKQSIGCYHNTIDTIVIKKEGDSLVLYYNIYKKSLSPDELISIQEFEKELHIIPESWCRTHVTYTISVGNKKFKKTDETCKWNGLYYLKKSLDLKSYKIPNTGGFW